MSSTWLHVQLGMYRAGPHMHTTQPYQRPNSLAPAVPAPACHKAAHGHVQCPRPNTPSCSKTLGRSSCTQSSVTAHTHTAPAPSADVHAAHNGAAQHSTVSLLTRVSCCWQSTSSVQQQGGLHLHCRTLSRTRNSSPGPAVPAATSTTPGGPPVPQQGRATAALAGQHQTEALAPTGKARPTPRQCRQSETAAACPTPARARHLLLLAGLSAACCASRPARAAVAAPTTCLASRPDTAACRLGVVQVRFPESDTAWKLATCVAAVGCTFCCAGGTSRSRGPDTAASSSGWPVAKVSVKLIAA